VTPFLLIRKKVSLLVPLPYSSRLTLFMPMRKEDRLAEKEKEKSGEKVSGLFPVEPQPALTFFRSMKSARLRRRRKRMLKR
jgi:hypothetical protein